MSFQTYNFSKCLLPNASIYNHEYDINKNFFGFYLWALLFISGYPRIRRNKL